MYTMQAKDTKDVRGTSNRPRRTRIVGGEERRHHHVGLGIKSLRFLISIICITIYTLYSGFLAIHIPYGDTTTSSMESTKENYFSYDVISPLLRTDIERNNNIEEDDDDEHSNSSSQQVMNANNDNDDDADLETNVNGPMNILILYPDDWRHDSIGSVNPIVKTPFLNQLAKEGIRFTQNAVTTSVCWMSRATLFTGQFSSRHQSLKPKCPHFVKEESWNHTWPYILQKNDYFVGHIGKWQFVHRKPSRTQKMFNWTNLFEGKHYINVKGEQVHSSDYTKDAALSFLKHRPRDKPFALTAAFYPPKPVGSSRNPGGQFFPTDEMKKLYENVTLEEPEMEKSLNLLPQFLQPMGTAARDRWFNRYRTSLHYQESMKNYYALISGVDKACKEIVDQLKKDDLYDSTMIIFTTDNGMSHGAHGLAGKWYPYQESIRVPLIIYDPRMPPSKMNTVDDSFTLNIDLAETILSAAGIKADTKMQGRDISDLYLKNNTINHNHNDPWREEFFYEFPYEDNDIPSSTALVRKDWKYIHWPEFNYEQLFDLKNDPLELDDLVNRTTTIGSHHDGVLSEMRERHNELRNTIQEPEKSKMECSMDGFW